MKKIIISCCAVSALFAVATTRPVAQETKSNNSGRVAEYATVRFAEDRTSIVWADGTAEKVMELAPAKKFNNGSEKYPKDTDYRMYWLTIAMNIMAQRGYELVSINGPDVVMKRSVRAN